MDNRSIYNTIAIEPSQGKTINGEIKELRSLASDLGILAFRDQSGTGVVTQVCDQFEKLYKGRGMLDVIKELKRR